MFDQVVCKSSRDLWYSYSLEFRSRSSLSSTLATVTLPNCLALVDRLTTWAVRCSFDQSNALFLRLLVHKTCLARQSEGNLIFSMCHLSTPHDDMNDRANANTFNFHIRKRPAPKPRHWEALWTGVPRKALWTVHARPWL